MKKVLYIHRHSLNPEGGGGHHRAYQIFNDLKTCVGEEKVETLRLFDKSGHQFSGKKLYPTGLKAQTRLILQESASRSRFSAYLSAIFHRYMQIKSPFGKVPLEPYFEFLKNKGKPAVCIVDYPNFLELISFNRLNQIPTIYCPQNIDSFDRFTLKMNIHSQRLRFSHALLTEMDALIHCQERLMISKMEVNLLTSLGISAIYYPYLPKGAIKSNLSKIRKLRGSSTYKDNYFLMVGSIFHKPTLDGFRWVLEQIRSSGLPRNTKLVIGGLGGSQLNNKYSDLENVTIFDRIEQNQLNHFLTNTAAMLIPQFSGFGALSRISEMACAGVPMIISNHPSKAIDLPVGVIMANRNWGSWISAMDKALEEFVLPHLEDYQAWENQQPNPIHSIMKNYLG
jgi:hypothetical protein